MSRHGRSYRCVHNTPPEEVKPSKSAPCMGVRLNLGGFDIISIDTHHETSAELSRSSGDDDVASRLLLPVRTPLPRITSRGV